MNIDLLAIAQFCAAVLMVTITLAVCAFVAYVVLGMLLGKHKKKDGES